MTPLARFDDCYRLDFTFQDPYNQGAGFRSFWFARGIGIVQYTRYLSRSVKTFPLKALRLRGTDGKQYLLSGPAGY